jgi:hypothetical protein
MKVFCFLLYVSIFVLCAGTANAQAATKEDLVSIQKELSDQKKLITELKDSLNFVKENRIKKLEALYTNGGDIPVFTTRWWLCFMPVLLSLGLFFYFKYKRNLRDAISKAVTDKDAPIEGVARSVIPVERAMTLEGKEVIVKQNETVETPITTGYARSASRMALFFSSFLSLILALSFSTVFLYGYLSGRQTMPDYSTLVNVLLALGIGVVPYAVNQFNKPANPTNAEGGRANR